jgi:hypothetical protein
MSAFDALLLEARSKNPAEREDWEEDLANDEIAWLREMVARTFALSTEERPAGRLTLKNAARRVVKD